MCDVCTPVAVGSVLRIEPLQLMALPIAHIYNIGHWAVQCSAAPPPLGGPRGPEAWASVHSAQTRPHGPRNGAQPYTTPMGQAHTAQTGVPPTPRHPDPPWPDARVSLSLLHCAGDSGQRAWPEGEAAYMPRGGVINRRLPGACCGVWVWVFVLGHGVRARC